MVLVMQNSLSMGLYMNNATIVKDTLDRAFAVMVVSSHEDYTAVMAKSNIV